MTDPDRPDDRIRAALELGVTGEEILEVLKLATVVGIHSCNVGVPILVEELASQRSSRPSSSSGDRE